jgi:hypothetical protein
MNPPQSVDTELSTIDAYGNRTAQNYYDSRDLLEKLSAGEIY